jgi:hypothetical protein
MTDKEPTHKERDKETEAYITQLKQVGRQVTEKNGLLIVQDHKDNPDYDMSGPYL